MPCNYSKSLPFCTWCQCPWWWSEWRQKISECSSKTSALQECVSNHDLRKWLTLVSKMLGCINYRAHQMWLNNHTCWGKYVINDQIPMMLAATKYSYETQFDFLIAFVKNALSVSLIFLALPLNKDFDLSEQRRIQRALLHKNNLDNSVKTNKLLLICVELGNLLSTEK